MEYEIPEFSIGVADGFAEPPIPFRAVPVTDTDDKFNRLRLIRSRRVGPVTYRRLLAEHGTAAAALAALPDMAGNAGIKGYEVCSEALVRSEIKAAQRIGARLICLGDTDYPEALAEVPDAPPAFWARGNRELLAKPMISMVGTRNASSLGTRMARRLATDLGNAGYICVSGMARGVDAAAHAGSIDTGTIAVLGGGVDVPYPPENTALLDEIVQKGLVVSERPMGLHPQARDFPRRNRIISGLSRVLVVVEAAARSGSMITASNALDQGREVMAVPGHPLDTRTSGGNALLRDGAGMVRRAEDIIEVLERYFPPEVIEPATEPEQDTYVDPTMILSRLTLAPAQEDDLANDLGVAPAHLGAVLAELELMGEVTRAPGGQVSRAA